MRTISSSILIFFFFSSRRRHTRFDCDWSSDVCSSDLGNSEKTRYWSLNSENLLASKATVSGLRRSSGERLPSSSLDRKSTRLNSSHSQISYAVFCLKKKNQTSNI